jgi:uncharacterized OB-fold protein
MSTYGDLDKLNTPGLPVPAVTELSRPHWEACQRGELLVQRCDDCGHYVFTPEVACTACLSSSLVWVRSSGRGVLYSFTVIHRPQRPEFDAPYVGAIIELEEGWHMLSNMVDCNLDSLAIGQPVEVCFVPRGDNILLPMFRPLQTEGSAAGEKPE